MLCLDFPASGNSNEPHVSCFLEAPDSSRYTHCRLPLSAHCHRTHPAPSLEAFPNRFSNSWNLLPVIRQVSLDHRSKARLRGVRNMLRDVMSLEGPLPRPSRPAACARSRDSPGQTATVCGHFSPTLSEKKCYPGVPLLIIASALIKTQFPHVIQQRLIF